VIWITDTAKVVGQNLYTTGGTSPPQKMEPEMRRVETADITSLSDAELNDVNGGIILQSLIAVGGAAALLIGMSGPNVGTMEEQAAALGMSHLL
jgi:lactobin A/cerein 7B family class IIb bacteriocin